MVSGGACDACDAFGGGGGGAGDGDSYMCLVVLD